MTLRELEQTIGATKRQIEQVCLAAERLERRAQYRSHGDDWEEMEAEAAELRGTQLPRLYQRLHALERRRPLSAEEQATRMGELLQACAPNQFELDFTHELR